MSVGPVQLVVLGFDHADFQDEIVAELEQLRRSDAVRVIDSLAVYKAADGAIEIEPLSNLTTDAAIDIGSRLAALIGAEAEEGDRSDDETWDVLAGIPDGSAAALILLEHHWAAPLRDAVVHAGGYRIDDGFLDPLDLVEIGLLGSDDRPAEHGSRGLPAPRASSEQGTNAPL